MGRGGAIGAGVLLVLAGGARAQDKEQRAAEPSGDMAAFFGPEAYPADAIRAREQGRVIAKLQVDAAGRVTTCTVDVSSGSASLDRTTCEIARTKMVFTPARDDRGRTMASSYTLPVRWVLPERSDMVDYSPRDLDKSPPVANSVEIALLLAGDGRVERCTVRQLSPADLPDPCAEYPVGFRYGGGAVRNGKPVRGQVVLRFTQTMSYER